MSRNQNYNINEFLQYIHRLTVESDRRYNDANLEVCELMVNKLSTARNALKFLEIAQQSGCPELDIIKVADLKLADYELLLNWKDLHEKTSSVPVKFDYSRYKCKQKHSLGNRGRPSYKVDIEMVKNLQALSFNWSQIAELIGIHSGIHRTTLWRILFKNYPEILDNKYSNITIEELDTHIHKLKEEHSLAGERMIIGFLRAKQFRV